MYLSPTIFLSENKDIFRWLLQEHMARFETSVVLHHNKPQTKFFSVSACVSENQSSSENKIEPKDSEETSRKDASAQYQSAVQFRLPNNLQF